jgi:hypothetical protein
LPQLHQSIRARSTDVARTTIAAIAARRRRSCYCDGHACIFGRRRAYEGNAYRRAATTSATGSAAATFAAGPSRAGPTPHSGATFHSAIHPLLACVAGPAGATRARGERNAAQAHGRAEAHQREAAAAATTTIAGCAAAATCAAAASGRTAAGADVGAATTTTALAWCAG